MHQSLLRTNMKYNSHIVLQPSDEIGPIHEDKNKISSHLRYVIIFHQSFRSNRENRNYYLTAVYTTCSVCP